MKIIVGLGNFGDDYAYTFHNMGFLAVECLADRLNVKISKKQCDALVGETNVDGEKVVIAQPLTYMNLSGNAVKKLLDYYKATPKDLLVIYDDIDLEKASTRKRAKGSSGTHNGMRHIIATIKTEEFARLRIGVGRPPMGMPLADFVLSTIPKADRPAFVEAFEKTADDAELFIKGKLF